MLQSFYFIFLNLEFQAIEMDPTEIRLDLGYLGNEIEMVDFSASSQNLLPLPEELLPPTRKTPLPSIHSSINMT